MLSAEVIFNFLEASLLGMIVETRNSSKILERENSVQVQMNPYESFFFIVICFMLISLIRSLNFGRI